MSQKGKRFFFIIVFTSLPFLVMGKANRGIFIARDGAQLQRLSFRYNSKEGIGLQDVGYSTVEYFIATQGIFRTLTFADVRGHIFDDGKWAANAGVGFRYRQKKFPIVFGVNAYYDYRRNIQHSFHQTGVGLEFLANIFKFRLNGYIPLGDKQKFQKAFFSNFEAHHIVLDKLIRLSMYGADAELEARLVKYGCVEFFTGWGPYYYKGDFGTHAFGVRGRAGFDFNRVFQASVKGTYDNLFRFNIQGEFRLSFHFGKKVKTKRKTFPKKICCEREQFLKQRLVDPIYRQEIVVLSDQKEKAIAKNTNGDSLFFLFVNNAATSGNIGTFENPFQTLALAESNSNIGDFIYVDLGDGTFNGMNTGFIMKEEQTLFGSSTNQFVSTNLGEILIPAQTFGIKPIITNTIAADIIELANGNTISGFRINSAPQFGIISSAPLSGSTIINNDIIDSGVGDAGIFIDVTSGTQVAGDFIIRNNTISSSNGTSDGVRIDLTGVTGGATRLNIFIEENNISNLTSEGISITRTTGTQECVLAGCISNNRINNNSAQGIDIAHGGAAAGILLVLDIKNNTFISNGSEGIQMNRARGTLNISGNLVQQNGGTAGVEIDILGSEVLFIDVLNNRFANNNATPGFLIDTNDSSFVRMTFSGNVATGGDTFDFSEDGASVLEVDLGRNVGALTGDDFTLVN